jgi:hypothetical protein
MHFDQQILFWMSSEAKAIELTRREWQVDALDRSAVWQIQG